MGSGKTVVLAERLERAAASIELDRRDLARVLETNPRTVSRWLNQETAPRPDARERLLELIAVLERLSATLRPAAAHDWLFTPNLSLDYHKPVDLLREGEFRRVLGAIDALAEGVFVQHVSSQELVARVDALGATALEAVAFRHVTVGANPRSGTGARIHGGRWNPPNSFATLYLGLDAETVADEFHRMARRQGLTPHDFLPREVHRFDVRLAAVLDLREAEARQAVELSDQQLRADDPRRCQEIGEAAHYVGLEGIVAPSAAGPGTVLAIFLEKLRPGSLLEPLSSQTWDTPPPRRS